MYPVAETCIAGKIVLILKLQDEELLRCNETENLKIAIFLASAQVNG